LLCSRPGNAYLVSHLALSGNNLARVVSRFGRNAGMLLAELKILFDPSFELADHRCICSPCRRRSLAFHSSADQEQSGEN
jgi:hypothetical protein